MDLRPLDDLIERLQETVCDHVPFTPEHADCECRTASAAALQIAASIRKRGHA